MQWPVSCLVHVAGTPPEMRLVAEAPPLLLEIYSLFFRSGTVVSSLNCRADES